MWVAWCCLVNLIAPSEGVVWLSVCWTWERWEELCWTIMCIGRLCDWTELPTLIIPGLSDRTEGQGFIMAGLYDWTELQALIIPNCPTHVELENLLVTFECCLKISNSWKAFSFVRYAAIILTIVFLLYVSSFCFIAVSENRNYS